MSGVRLISRRCHDHIPEQRSHLSQIIRKHILAAVASHIRADCDTDHHRHSKSLRKLSQICHRRHHIILLICHRILRNKEEIPQILLRLL